MDGNRKGRQADGAFLAIVRVRMGLFLCGLRRGDDRASTAGRFSITSFIGRSLADGRLRGSGIVGERLALIDRLQLGREPDNHFLAVRRRRLLLNDHGVEKNPDSISLRRRSTTCCDSRIVARTEKSPRRLIENESMRTPAGWRWRAWNRVHIRRLIRI